MNWRRTAGGLAVLLVAAVVVGVAVTLATANDLFLASARRLPALVTLAVVLVGLGAVVVLGGPSRDWLDNPYW